MDTDQRSARITVKTIVVNRFDHRANWATKHSTDGALPGMIDCVACHDQSRRMPARARMSNCRTCHADSREGPVPSDHARDVKPDFHTETFRTHHQSEASAPGAKCFACHQNLAADGKQSVHSMPPGDDSHTARWKDDLHGKYAALDRTTCATCHQQDYCSHAMPAMLDQRACMTCHTYQNTCASCHLNALSPAATKKM
jgi:hypothetical protein